MTDFIAPEPKELDKYFTQYEVTSFIAQGGMGAVYLGKQLSLDRSVAIKILPTELGSEHTYLESFKSEAKSLACLNHSNLVGIHDFGEVEGMFYIIMEYVPGRSLYHVTDGNSVNEKESAFLVSEVCKGLAHAHEHGILHRDIKPENILIDDEARPKLVDFGLAKPIDCSDHEGVAFGTQGFMAPETVQDPNAVDHRADIYSVGVLLYELLTATLPETPYIPASSQNGTDKRFDSIIEKAIHPDPQARYSSCLEMAAELDKLVENWVQPKKDSLTKGTKILATAASLGPPVALGAPSAATAALLAKKSATTGILGTPTSVLAGPPVVIAKKKNYGVIALVATLALMLGIAGAALVFMGDDSEDAVSAVEEDIAEDETIETHSNSEGPVSSGEMLSRLKEEPIADAVAGNKRKKKKKRNKAAKQK